MDYEQNKAKLFLAKNLKAPSLHLFFPWGTKLLQERQFKWDLKTCLRNGFCKIASSENFNIPFIIAVYNLFSRFLHRKCVDG
jgi:hypothetical protein